MLVDALRPGHRFRSTRWSLVRAAANSQDPGGQKALEALCRSYWEPVYSYVRRCGHGTDSAQDLTQGFFALLLEKRYLKLADPNRGRFRSFLLTAVKNYMANQWDHDRAAKRGGGKAILSLDFAWAETTFRYEPVDEMTPERAYERRWALAVLERVLDRLRVEQEDSGRGTVFTELRPWLTSIPTGVTYGDIAPPLGMSESAVKVAVHRLRRRYGQLLREEIAQTVSDGSQLDAEIRHLFAALEP